MSPSPRARTIPFAALLALAAGTAAAVGAPPALTARTIKEGTSIRLGEVEVAVASGRVARPRTLTFPGSETVLMTWDEYSGAAKTSRFALSLDGGRTVAQVSENPGLVRLRYAQFDPLAGAPMVPKELASGPDNELYLVQFVSTPLEEMRAPIIAAGGDVLRFLTDNTHIIRMTPEVAAKVAALPYVRWVGAYHPAYRLDGETRALLASGEAVPAARYSIECMHRGRTEQAALVNVILGMGGQIHVTTPDQFRIEATLTRQQLLGVLARNEVSFVDPWVGPGGPDMDLIRQTGGAVPLLSNAGFLGQGVRGEIFDTGVVATHQQWNGQAPLVHNATNSDSHGNACYGINFATGTGNAQATGMCPQREQGIFSFYNATSQFGGGPSRLTLNTEAVNPAGNYKSTYQTSSVGSTQTTAYTTVSAEVDDYLFKVDYLSCQSQSNVGDRRSRPQAWAKNIVSVGGLNLNETVTRNDDIWDNGASIGPAQDLRVKPDLSHSFDGIFTTYSTSATGYGQFGGTSGATPITAGHFGLLMQLWHQGVWPLGTGHTGGGASVFADRPKSQTAKALMINGAYRYPINSPITNQMFRGFVGWGSADLTRLYNGRDKHFIVNQSDVLTNAQTKQYILTVSAGEPELRATMIYPDPMGSTAAAQQRINDLTLKVTDPNGVIYWGNNGMVPTATSGPGQQAGANFSTSGGSGNTYDTVENVFVQNPVAGGWKVEVTATQIVQDGNLGTPAMDAVFSLVVAGVTVGPPPALTITFPNGRPSLVAPGVTTDVDVNIAAASQTVTPGTPTLWYRPTSSGAFTGSALASLGGDSYRATLPASVCANHPEYYVTAVGNLGANVASPLTAPAQTYTTKVGTTALLKALDESFEAGIPAGWTATGLWHANSTCAPGGACDGAVWAYYGLDGSCTYNSPTGSTGTLTSPPIDLTGAPAGSPITLTYCSAKLTENSATFDKATVLVNGADVVDEPPESPDFQTRTIDLSTYAGQTITLSWVFDTVDATANDFRGWHIDHVQVVTPGVVCVDTSVCYANCDGSTNSPVLNIADFTCFIQKFAEADPYANCDGSTAAPTLNVADFTCFIQKFAAGCT